MPTYVYEALNAAGKPEKGRIEADTSDAAIAAIRQNGFFPTTVREEKIRGGSGKNEGKKDATSIITRRASFHEQLHQSWFGHRKWTITHFPANSSYHAFELQHAILQLMLGRE